LFEANGIIGRGGGDRNHIPTSQRPARQRLSATAPIPIVIKCCQVYYRFKCSASSASLKTRTPKLRRTNRTLKINAATGAMATRLEKLLTTPIVSSGMNDFLEARELKRADLLQGNHCTENYTRHGQISESLACMSFVNHEVTPSTLERNSFHLVAKEA